MTITLYMSELTYDFKNKAFLTGRARRTDANAEQAANMQASDDEEDMNQAVRSIQNGFRALLTELSEGLYGVATVADATVSDGADSGKAAAGSKAADTPSGEETSKPSTGASGNVTDGSVSNNALMSETSNIVVTMKVPSNFVMALKDTLTACMHSYIVNKALAEWLLITDKADAAEYAGFAQNDMAQLRRTFYRRERPTRKEVGG